MNLKSFFEIMRFSIIFHRKIPENLDILKSQEEGSNLTIFILDFSKMSLVKILTSF